MTANLLSYSAEQLAVLFSEALNEKPFRAKQVFRWIHQKGVSDFAQMSDLAVVLKAKLHEKFQVQAMDVVSEHVSRDGTIKWLFDVGQSNAVESVYIPEATRGTLCVSSQAGCAVNCRFCSTGHQGFNRNLNTWEIIAQLWFAEFNLRRRAAPLEGQERVISNVVMMGMGEPLLNYDELVPALKMMLDDNAYGLSRRRVTVSSSGVVPMIDRLAKDCPTALAISLHAPNDALRDELVPLNKKYPIRELLDSCVRYLDYAPRDFITFEYCMLDGVNDTPAHATELAKLLKGRVPCKLNLIPFNPFPQSGLKRSQDEAINRFAKILLDAGLVTTVRKTRGDDIDAACGQLAGEVQDRTNRERRMQRRVVTLHPLN